jgi:hypothetical protein
MYDKYKNWPLPTRMGPPPRAIQEQVLRDLRAPTDDPVNSDVEALEILDSYAIYCARVYQQDTAQELSQRAGRLIASILQPFILEQIPVFPPPYRGRRTQPPPAQEEVKKP